MQELRRQEQHLIGRKFIGIEIDPTHYDTAVARITKELSRTALLEPVAKITQRSLLP